MSSSSGSGVTDWRVISTELWYWELLAHTVKTCISNSPIGAPEMVPFTGAVLESAPLRVSPSGNSGQTSQVRTSPPYVVPTIGSIGSLTNSSWDVML